MVPRELIALATLTTLSVATSAAAVAAAAAAAAASIDFDLTGGGGGDYEVLPDTEERTSTADNDDVADASRDSTTYQRNGNSNHASLIHGARSQQHQQHHQYQAHQQHHGNGNTIREVRCFCNQPNCVSQGYMCMGRGCFTELPLLSIAAASNSGRSVDQLGIRPEHASYSGCLEKSFAERPCPPGKLCCEQDLCNHIDSPAMRLRLNKTLQVLLGEHRTYFGPGVQSASGQEMPSSSDGWFRTATIAVPICGFIVLVILASLAIRLLQPLPSQNDKFTGLRMPPESAPPLLGPPKLPLV